MDGQQTHQSQVGFPSQAAKQKGGFPKWIIAMVGVLIILAVGGFLIFKVFKQSGEPIETPSSTPIVQGLSDINTNTPEPSATPAAVSKSEVKIEVLNGTGIPGEAGLLKDALASLGYTEITTGNASSTGVATTTVTFSSSLPQTNVDEITQKLQSTYKEVSAKKGTLSGKDVSITTGTRKGSTAKTPAPTSKASASPSPTASASPSPSPSSTP